MTERPEISCPECGQGCEKVFNASGIKFEGSGFYNTDQRDGGSGTSSTASSGHSCGCADCPHNN